MTISIQCPTCSKRYQVADAVGGKRVRCQQCGNSFTAAPATAHSPAAPAVAAESALGVDLSQLPAVAAPVATAPFAPAAYGAAPSAAWGSSLAGGVRVSNPSGGPTDIQMRLLSAVMLVAGLLMIVASFALQASQGTVYLIVIALSPLALVVGITGLISPDVVRAMGKYGGHLPWRYKAIGWGVTGIAFLLIVLLVAALLLSGFELDRPGARNRRTRLPRSQMPTVIDRTRNAHSVLPDAKVVSTFRTHRFGASGRVGS